MAEPARTEGHHSPPSSADEPVLLDEPLFAPPPALRERLMAQIAAEPQESDKADASESVA
ncbi:hypothetical protein FBQ96_06280 [Nitrospirales bacterium NOB]|nr:hypothetical protein [Nitrospirota bacterium]MCE7965605.1 hypothetical protein [Nitrospira sp. NTP2]MDL1889177.1 hypothetical protein [Nitrospirales bacterium NOB]